MDLGKKRGIYLLNTSYKIFAKALARRSTAVLQTYINPSQSAFIPGRFILDNIMLVSELQKWVEDLDQEAIFLSIDFAKAYDRVEWSFLMPMLRKMGFGETFISFVKVLISRASATVSVNGVLSRSFVISRSVRQGCPFAPFLFLLVRESFCQLLDHESTLRKFEGVCLLGGDSKQLYSLFVDDTMLSIRADVKALENLLCTMTTYAHATGLAISWTKSSAIWVAKSSRPPCWQ